MLSRRILLLIFLGLSVSEIYSMNQGTKTNAVGNKTNTNKRKTQGTKTNTQVPEEGSLTKKHKRTKSLPTKKEQITLAQIDGEKKADGNLQDQKLSFDDWYKNTNDIIDAKINWVNNNRWWSLGITAVSALILCKIFEEPIKRKAKKFKDYCEEKMFDALLKWEDIKENGLNKRDYIKGLLTLVLAGGLSAGIYTYDVDTVSLMKEVLRLMGVHKIEVGATLLGLFLGKCLYNLKASYDTRQSRIMNFDNFLAQLSEEQRRMIFNSEDLLVIVGKGGDNHKRLLNNKEFMSILTEDQKAHLKNIVRYRCSTVKNEIES